MYVSDFLILLINIIPVLQTEMRKLISLLQIILTIVSITAHAQNDNDSLSHLYVFAGKSLNYSSTISEDRILKLCQAQEAYTRNRKDYDNLFAIQEIVVNTYCLKGDIGLAVDKAQQMYAEAKELKSELGVSLAFQALGITYMYSNQYQQAYNTFTEAYKILGKSGNQSLKIRSLIQQIHVCMLLEDIANMQQHLVEARKLLDRADIPEKQDYAFYLQYYQTLYYIASNDKELARISLEDINKMVPQEATFSRLYFNLYLQFHELNGEYEQALAYCDSILALAIKSHNLSEYKDLLKMKAVLLEKSDEKQQACVMYDSAEKVSKRLNMMRYSQQIDSLHVSYWVDQLALENAAMRNRFLKWMGALTTLLLVFAIYLMYIARKKNRKLILSKQKLEVARRETQASIQSKSLFLSNMSHELRTPLNAIVGFANLLSLEAVESSQGKQQIGDRIKQNADLLLRLFNDVADLSALKGKNIKFTFETCNVVALCSNVMSTVESVKQTAAALYFDTSLEKLPLYTDPGRLQQVLINLLINATKFTSEGSIRLILEVDKEQNEAVFTVEDTGCGIPLSKQPHIFDRFEKLHEGVQGAGLGLSICQLIIERLKGRIWIDSSYTQGARFVFTHPLLPQTAEL